MIKGYLHPYHTNILYLFDSDSDSITPYTKLVENYKNVSYQLTWHRHRSNNMSAMLSINVETCRQFAAFKCLNWLPNWHCYSSAWSKILVTTNLYSFRSKNKIKLVIYSLLPSGLYISLAHLHMFFFTKFRIFLIFINFVSLFLKVFLYLY